MTLPRLIVVLWLAALVLVGVVLWVTSADAQQSVLSIREQQALKATFGPSGFVERIILKENASHAPSTVGFARIVADSASHTLLCSFGGGTYAACTSLPDTFYTDVTVVWGAKCDGTDQKVPIENAIAAGVTRLFIPAGCKWVPTGNVVPSGLDILGGDWDTTIIASSNVVTIPLSVGNNTTVRNVSIAHKRCTDAPGAPVRCPTKAYTNVSGATREFANWPRQPLAAIVGGSDLGTDQPGIYVESFGNGDPLFCQTNAAAACVNIYGKGIGGPSGNPAVNVSRFTSAGGMNISTSDVAATGGYGLQIGTLHMTGGALLTMSHTTTTFSGTGIAMNMAAGSGTFNGSFLLLQKNNITQALIDAQGSFVTSSGTYFSVGGERVGLVPPLTLPASISFRLPNNVGVNGQCVATDGNTPATLAFINCGGGGAGTITSIGGQSGPVITAGANDTNITLIWANNTVTPRWVSTLAAARGGLGTDAAGFTGLVQAIAGVFSATLTPTITSLTASSSITGLIADKGGQVFNVRAFGAVVCDGAGGTDSGAAINAARAAAVAVGGGSVEIPAGAVCRTTVKIDADGTSNITIRGAGGNPSLSVAPPHIVYTGGATTSVISARASHGFRLEGVSVSDATGNPECLVDLRGTSTIAVTSQASVVRTTLSTAGSKAICVAKSVLTKIEDNSFVAAGSRAIQGLEQASDVGFTTVTHVIGNNHFAVNIPVDIEGLDQASVVQGATFECPGTSAYIQGAVADATSLTYKSNWHGDCGSATRTWVVARGRITADGNVFGDLNTTAFSFSGSGTVATLGVNDYQNIPVANRVVTSGGAIVHGCAQFPNISCGFGVAVPRGITHSFGVGYALVQGASGAGGTTFGASDTIPIVSGQGVIGYDGLAILPASWGNVATVDQHRAIYLAGAQRNVGATVSNLAFANWGYFTNTGAGAGGLANATAQADAVKFRFQHLDLGSAFNQRLDLFARTGSGTEIDVWSMLSSGSVGFNSITPAAKVDIRGNAIISTNLDVLPAFPGTLQVAGLNSTQSSIVVDGFAAGSPASTQSAVILRTAGGTPTARSAVQSQSPLGALIGAGAFDGVNYSSSQSSVGFFAAENWAAGARGTFSTFGVTPIGSTTLTEALRISGIAGGAGVRTSMAPINAGPSFTNSRPLYLSPITSGTRTASVPFSSTEYIQSNTYAGFFIDHIDSSTSPTVQLGDRTSVTGMVRVQEQAGFTGSGMAMGGVYQVSESITAGERIGISGYFDAFGGSNFNGYGVNGWASARTGTTPGSVVPGLFELFCGAANCGTTGVGLLAQHLETVGISVTAAAGIFSLTSLNGTTGAGIGFADAFASAATYPWVGGYSPRFRVRANGSIATNMPAGTTNAALDLAINGNGLFAVHFDGRMFAFPATYSAGAIKTLCIDDATGEIYRKAGAC